MAGRGDELNTRLTATDAASKVIDDVAEKVADLEDKPHEIELDADTSKAEAAAKALDARLDGLTNREKQVVLEIQARNAQREIDQINKSLATASKYDNDEIALRVEAKGNAEAKLQAIQAEIREIDGATPNVDVKVDSSEVDDLVGKVKGLGAIGVGAGLLNSAKGLHQMALDAAEVSNLTGDTLDNASRLNAVWAKSGGETGDLLDTLLQMTGALADAPELAERLGVNLNDGATSGERFVEVVDKLRTEISDTTERSVLGSKLFGEEGVRQVNRIVTKVGDLRVAVENVPSAKIIDDEDIDRMREYERRLDRAKEQRASLERTLAEQLVFPAMDFLSFDGGNEVRQIRDRERALEDLRAEFENNATAAGRAHGANTSHAESLKATAAAAEEAEAKLAATVAETEALDYQARLTHNEMAGMLEGGFRVEDIERFNTAIGLTVDELAALKGAADPTWTAHLADLERLQGMADGAPGYFSDLEEAARNAMGAVDEATTSLSIFDQERARLAEEETTARIIDQFARQREAAVKLSEARGTDDEVEAERRYQEENRRTQGLVLDYLETLEDVPDEMVTKIRADIKAGNLTDVENQLNELTKDRLVEIVAEIRASITSGLQSVGATFAPGRAPTVTINPTVRPPETVIYDNRTNNYLTSNPTDAAANERRYEQRGNYR